GPSTGHLRDRRRGRIVHRQRDSRRRGGLARAFRTARLGAVRHRAAADRRGRSTVTPTPHSEQGARKGEPPGRSSNPVIKVHDLAWLEFQKPDLVRAEAFAQAFGFTTVSRSGDELQLRGSDPGSPCGLIRRGPTSRFIGAAFAAADTADIRRLAEANGATTRALPETIGGVAVGRVGPTGKPGRVGPGTLALQE